MSDVSIAFLTEASWLRIYYSCRLNSDYMPPVWKVVVFLACWVFRMFCGVLVSTLNVFIEWLLEWEAVWGFMSVENSPNEPCVSALYLFLPWLDNLGILASLIVSFPIYWLGKTGFELSGGNLRFSLRTTLFGLAPLWPTEPIVPPQTLLFLNLPCRWRSF